LAGGNIPLELGHKPGSLFPPIGETRVSEKLHGVFMGFCPGLFSLTLVPLIYHTRVEQPD